jgi:hypothetical protein
MKKLFLDDIRNPKDCANGLVPTNFNKLYWEKDWFIVRNFNQFTDWILQNGLPDFISFDHDLADEHYNPAMFSSVEEYSKLEFKEKTGYDCAKWLGNYCIDNDIKLPDCVVHSQNPVGKINIQGYLENVTKFLNK